MYTTISCNAVKTGRALFLIAIITVAVLPVANASGRNKLADGFGFNYQPSNKTAPSGPTFVPGRYTPPKFSEPHFVDGNTQANGTYAQGHEVNGGYHPGGYRPSHWIHENNGF